MERNVPSLLLIHLVFFVLSAPPCAVSSVSNISKVVFIPHLNDWMFAQNYCRHFHDDLVTITNQNEATQLALYEGWIGLRRTFGVWKWSRGDENMNFKNWNTGHPQAGKPCAWKRQSHQKWERDHCNAHHSFICDERLIVSKEKKTWEEALEHCRAINDYDLVSLPEANTLLLNRETMKQQATTNEVWVGLRFLAVEWLWMGGREVTSSSLLHCPAQQQHCGALLRDTGGFITMNCAEKRNFLCGKKR